MNRRQDAARCLTKLKSHELQGKAITLAWAPGKGVKGKDLKDYWEGDLGVSYIPWSKIKPDIDLAMLEDGGVIDEDTMPAWMKAKVSAENPSQGILTQGSLMPMVEAPPQIDTSQPPPVPGGGLLQTPMTLPFVNPFQLNNRLIGPPVGMNLPGMMPNVPIGVPPPNLGGAFMANSLLGTPGLAASLTGTPFTQGPPGFIQGQPRMDKDKPGPLPLLSDTLISEYFISFRLSVLFLFYSWFHFYTLGFISFLLSNNFML